MDERSVSNSHTNYSSSILPMAFEILGYIILYSYFILIIEIPKHVVTKHLGFNNLECTSNLDL